MQRPILFGHTPPTPTHIPYTARTFVAASNNESTLSPKRVSHWSHIYRIWPLRKVD